MRFATFLNEDLRDENHDDKTPVVIAPGRFNPPHLGHKLVIDNLIEMGHELNAEPVVIIVDSGKRDERNPLDGDIRKAYLSKMFPKVRYEIAHNPYDAVERLATEHNMVPVGGVTGADRADNYKKMIGRIFGESVHNAYTARVLQRNTDSDNDVAGVSATKVRQAAANNDVNKVRAMTGLDHDDAIKMINMIRGAA